VGESIARVGTYYEPFPQRTSVSGEGRCYTAGRTLQCLALDYPTRPVRLVVGFAASGGTDIATRVIGQWLSNRLRQSVIAENRPGAGSSAEAELVVSAPPDGYTLLAVGLANAVYATPRTLRLLSCRRRSSSLRSAPVRPHSHAKDPPRSAFRCSGLGDGREGGRAAASVRPSQADSVWHYQPADLA
jgi:Tripartite tricarboxylate transporter family receptor